MKSNWKTEWKPLTLIVGLFLACFYLPAGVPRFDNAVTEAFELVKWYAREHVILCLIPALSLQSMLVLRTVMGTQKTVVYVGLVIAMATITGLIYGALC